MATTNPIQKHIDALQKQYAVLRKGKESLLVMLDEAESSESVYNSNAIENSTLTLKETETILLGMEVPRNHSLREIFEAKNLARVTEFIRKRSQENYLGQETILLLHQMLIGGIDDNIAGRFRSAGEYVRVGSHLAPSPKHIEPMIDDALLKYNSGIETYFVDKIARFHLDFETVHPFNDGNGRIGRVLINYQLLRLGFPAIIIRDKEKKVYYQAFNDYRDSKKTRPMEKIIALALRESLHKRIAYLQGQKIITLADHARKIGHSVPSVLNAARRQNIPAFRENGVWKIGEK
ncbi:MAG: Fic family protein [Candidatus Margulisiibacteriota bacterium]|jgi:Fic family protein